MKIQSFLDLEQEMRAVARGETLAPVDASRPSMESAESLVRLLTPENRALMRAIRDEKPQSVAELAKMTRRAEPNLSRTLAKLAACGLVELRKVQKRTVPVSVIGILRLEIDPYAMSDRIEVH
jgi:predicted transcriptional regulator